MGKFKTVVVDPPWPLEDMGFRRGNGVTDVMVPYDKMSMSDIAALPIQDVSDSDALVFCWTVNRYIRRTYKLIDGWGFRYAYLMTWIKSGGIQTPTTPCFNAEFIMVGRKGKPAYKETKAFSTANYWRRGKHSEKPEGFYDLLRRVTPAPRIDIFNRRPIPGFVGWGNESPPDSELDPLYQGILL